MTDVTTEPGQEPVELSVADEQVLRELRAGPVEISMTRAVIPVSIRGG